MARDDWYRRTTWTQSDQEAFFSRLNRSRSDGAKAQYVRIQAAHLQETGKKRLIKAALPLLDLMFEKWPERTELASAYLQKGECHEFLGETEKARLNYREAIEVQRQIPNVRTDVQLSFASLIAQTPYVDQFGEALEAIDAYEDESHFPFPRQQFRAAAARALIFAQMGDMDQARFQALRAFAEVNETHSGLSRHPKLGLVVNPDKRLVKKLRKIVKS